MRRAGARGAGAARAKCAHVMVPFFSRAPKAHADPGNLTGSELTAKVNKQRRYFLFQSDSLL